MKNVTKVALWISFIICVSCATTSMNVPVRKPARINLAGINKIAIGEFTGPSSADFTDELTTQLLQSQRYEVLDRQHLKQIFDELGLHTSGAIDAQSAVQLGEMIGSSALIFGRVSRYNYDENVSYYDWKDNKGVGHRSYTRKGVAEVGVTMQITDLRTGRLITSRNLQNTVNKETRNTDEAPAAINKDDALVEARNNVLSEFMHDIAPYTVYQRISFVSDKKVPELAQGIAMIKAGNWNDGISYFQQAVTNTPTNSKTFYDLGLAYSYTQEFDKAIKNLKKAYAMEPKKMYLLEMTRCKQLKADSEKLEQQMNDAMSN